MTKPVVYGPLSSSITIRNASAAVIGTSTSSTSVIGRGKKVTMVYGNADDPTGAPMIDTWIQVKQGTNTAMTKTDLEGAYVFFDGQTCLPVDGIFGSCAGAWTSSINFGPGNVSTSLVVFGQGASPAGAPAFPTPWTRADVRTVSQSAPLATITTPHLYIQCQEGRRTQPQLHVPSVTDVPQEAITRHRAVSAHAGARR
jgi:hypothetical protein